MRAAGRLLLGFGALSASPIIDIAIAVALAPNRPYLSPSPSPFTSPHSAAEARRRGWRMRRRKRSE
jgi:hypothetical protein